MQTKAKKASLMPEESTHREQHQHGGSLVRGGCCGCSCALTHQHEPVLLPYVGNTVSSCARFNSSAAGNDEFYIPAAGADSARGPLLRGQAAPAARFLPWRGTHSTHTALGLRTASPHIHAHHTRAVLPLHTLACLSPSVTPLQGSHT